MPLGQPNLFGLRQYDNQTSFFNGQTIFSPGVGYGLVFGYGVIFALLTIIITVLDGKYGGTKYDSEEFNTAGRSIKTGLVAVDVVSHWAWVSDLLQSSNEAFQYGVSGSFWYTASAAVQILLFGIVAIEVKRRAPKAHTVLELVRRRWGHAANFVFLYLCYLNNIITCATLFLGAGNVLVAATGMDMYAALILIPVSVVTYTVIGGLKATFTSSYLHTVIIYVTLNLFVFKVYASDSFPIGSIRRVWENLGTYARAAPVPGNKGGSYMTMFSRGGLEFGIVSTISSFGNVWADQSYWQSAIAAKPKAAFQAYILGGLLWIPIPLALATSLGLATVALDLPVSETEANQGLISVAAAQYVLGKGGVILILSIVFMAATSSGSAEFIAMSSLFTYDVYKAYLRPQATGRELLIVSRIAVVLLGIGMGAFSCFIYKVNVDVNFLFLVVGLLISSSVPPLSFMLIWPAMPKNAAIFGALGGQICAVIAWIAHAKIVYHELSISDSLQELGPTMDGAIVAVATSFIICTVWTIIAPDTTGSYNRFKEIELVEGTEEKSAEKFVMDQSMRRASIIAVVLSAILLFVWPLLTLPAGVFSEGYFALWVLISMIWAMIATLICTFLPLIESRDIIIKVIKSLLGRRQ
ncbi:hypothetical protein KP509_14G082300 [Ceratopteris richardii]|uniref:Urea active transporter n=1 Tax=Ceratopteris richardii TaxID=49495 RepID=A0A8T2TEV4_CERRI|nr:hypothetical protein KP509_14G082300 [Ceratopteris richardii]